MRIFLILAKLSCCTAMVLSLVASGQTSKRTLVICGSEIQIGASIEAVQAVFADARSSCKILPISANNFDITTATKLAKDTESMGNIIFENGKVSELQRPLRIEGDASAMAFRVFHLIQDFESTSNTKCTISSFKNRDDIGVFNGTEVICGNRTLKLVSADFNDGQRGIDVTEILRK